MKNEKLFGIDLGTTNSALSVYIGDGKSTIVRIEDAGRLYTTMPSCVMWLGDDKWVVGREAYQNRYMPNACYSIKSHIGTDYVHTFEYKGEKITKTPIEISAMILKAICDKAASSGYKDIKKVTITVPAEFSSREREDTRRAGELAGMEVVDIINEPTAAALQYNIAEIKKSKEVLVYDLGGGTFDLTHIKITAPVNLENLNLNFSELGIDLSTTITESTSEPKFEVIASGGNRKLGGDDIDTATLNYALADYAELYTDIKIKDKIINLQKDVFEKLRFAASEAKISLAGHMGGVVKISMEQYIPECTEVFTISFDHIKKSTEDIYKKTKTCIRKLLARNTSEDISEIILIGGSTKNLYLQQLLNDDYSVKYDIISTMEPDLSVSLGASIKTAVTLGSSNLKISDVAPYTISLGVSNRDPDTGELIAGRVDQIIRKNTPLPAMVAKSYTLKSETGDIPLRFYTGEATKADLCLKIAEYNLKKKDTSTDFDLVATIDTRGILTLRLKTGTDEMTIDLDGTLKSVDTDKYMSEKTTLVENKMVKRWRAKISESDASSNLNDLFSRFLNKGENTKTVFNQIAEEVKKFKDDSE
jgi:molecular chaperone DnaK